jgi:hypothetical protein
MTHASMQKALLPIEDLTASWWKGLRVEVRHVREN